MNILLVELELFSSASEATLEALMLVLSEVIFMGLIVFVFFNGVVFGVLPPEFEFLLCNLQHI